MALHRAEVWDSLSSISLRNFKARVFHRPRVWNYMEFSQRPSHHQADSLKPVQSFPVKRRNDFLVALIWIDMVPRNMIMHDHYPDHSAGMRL